jgi:alkylhydroperoxidase family enzyme
VAAVLGDWTTAPVSDGLRATLGLLRKVTLTPDEVGPGDVEAVREAGVGDDAIADALHVCALFNTIDRIADALRFELPPVGYFAETAQRFYEEGYAASEP